MSQSDSGESAEAEPVSVKERMALYQAAVSKRDAGGTSSVVRDGLRGHGVAGGGMHDDGLCICQPPK